MTIDGTHHVFSATFENLRTGHKFKKYILLPHRGLDLGLDWQVVLEQALDYEGEDEIFLKLTYLGTGDEVK